MGLMSIRRLAEAIDNSNEPKVVINATHPGYCRTEVFRNMKMFPLNYILAALEFVAARSAEQGARCVMDAASADNSHGRYYLHCRAWGWPGFMEGKEGEKLTDKVWGELKEFFDKYEPGLFDTI